MKNSKVDNLIKTEENGNTKNQRLVQEIIVLVFHQCLYNKQNITCLLVDTNFNLLLFNSICHEWAQRLTPQRSNLYPCAGMWYPLYLHTWKMLITLRAWDSQSADTSSTLSKVCSTQYLKRNSISPNGHVYSLSLYNYYYFCGQFSGDCNSNHMLLCWTPYVIHTKEIEIGGHFLFLCNTT